MKKRSKPQGHAIGICLVGGGRFRPDCRCGWRGPIAQGRAKALAAAGDHVSRSALGPRSNEPIRSKPVGKPKPRWPGLSLAQIARRHLDSPLVATAELPRSGWTYLGRVAMVCSEGCGRYLHVAVNSPSGTAILCDGCKKAWPLKIYDSATVAVVNEFIAKREREMKRRSSAERARQQAAVAGFDAMASDEPTGTLSPLQAGDGPRTHPKGGVAPHW